MRGVPADWDGNPNSLPIEFPRSACHFALIWSANDANKKRANEPKRAEEYPLPPSKVSSIQRLAMLLTMTGMDIGPSPWSLRYVLGTAKYAWVTWYDMSDPNKEMWLGFGTAANNCEEVFLRYCNWPIIDPTHHYLQMEKDANSTDHFKNTLSNADMMRDTNHNAQILTLVYSSLHQLYGSSKQTLSAKGSSLLASSASSS